MIARTVILAAVLCGAISGSAQGDVLSEAPLQVEGLWQQAPSVYGKANSKANSESRETLVIVDFGAADDRAPPAEDAYQRLLIIGTKGAGPATRVGVRKNCEYLCGAEAGRPTCHYSGFYAVNGKPPAALDALGQPIAALVADGGAVSITDPGQRHEIVLDPAAYTTFSALAWAPNSGMKVRLPDARDGVEESRVEVRYGDGPINAYAVGACRAQEVGPFVELTCQGAAFLMTGTEMLLASSADYNAPSARIVRRIVTGGRDAYLVHLGIKAQDVYGLLWRDRRGSWQARFRPRDYDMLC